MTYVIPSLVLLVIFLIICVALMMAYFLRKFTQVMDQQRESQSEQLSLLSKLIPLLSAKDPLSYQAIQSMDPIHSQTSDYPPIKSEEESLVEYYIKQYDGKEGDELDDVERSILNGG